MKLSRKSLVWSVPVYTRNILSQRHACKTHRFVCFEPKQAQKTQGGSPNTHVRKDRFLACSRLQRWSSNVVLSREGHGPHIFQASFVEGETTASSATQVLAICRLWRIIGHAQKVELSTKKLGKREKPEWSNVGVSGSKKHSCWEHQPVNLLKSQNSWRRQLLCLEIVGLARHQTHGQVCWNSTVGQELHVAVFTHNKKLCSCCPLDWTLHPDTPRSRLPLIPMLTCVGFSTRNGKHVAMLQVQPSVLVCVREIVVQLLADVNVKLGRESTLAQWKRLALTAVMFPSGSS